MRSLGLKDEVNAMEIDQYSNCAAQSLADVLACLEVRVTPDLLEKNLPWDRSGVSFRQLMEAGDTLNVYSEAFKWSPGELETHLMETGNPTIIHWGEAHFVACVAFKNGEYIFQDRGNRRGVSTDGR